MRDNPWRYCKDSYLFYGWLDGPTLVTHILVRTYATCGVALFGAVNNATS